MTAITTASENTWINADNVRSAGGDLDSVWVGKLGAVMPDGMTVPEEHANIGWLSDEGIELGHDDNTETFNGHQGGKVVRKKVTTSEDTFKFTALESTALTYGLIHDIRSRTTEGSGANGTYTRMKVTGSKKQNDRRSWIVDLWDGDIWERYLIPSGEVGERPTVNATNSDLKTYEFTVTVYGSYEILTNDPAQAVGASE